MINDNIPPQFSSAVLNEGPGTLVINFNENIDQSSVIVSSFAISDGANPTDTVSLGGTTHTSVNSTAITITLTESQRGSAVSYTTPQLDITAGAIRDVTQNGIASSAANPITMIIDSITNDINSNGGSSSNDWKKKPTFGKSWEISGAQLVENGFTFNDYTLDITDNFHTDFVLTESIIGDFNHVDIKVYTDKILRDVTLSLGVPEIGKISDAETDIIIQLDRDYTIPDDYTITEIIHEQKESLVNEEDTHSSISKVKCTSNSPDELCYTIEIDFSISAPLKSNVLAISATDFDRRNTVTYINDGVEFTGESLLEPAVNSIYSKKGSQYEMETITLTQQDRRYQIWEDDNGYLWTQNNVGTWFQITTPDNTRDDDPYSSVMTRMHSEHASLVLDEQERATLLFDSTKLVSVPAETFSYDFTGTSKDQQQSKMEMFAYELEIEESKAQAIIDVMLNPNYHNNRHTSSSHTDDNNDNDNNDNNNNDIPKAKQYSESTSELQKKFQSLKEQPKTDHKTVVDIQYKNNIVYISGMLGETVAGIDNVTITIYYDDDNNSNSNSNNNDASTTTMLLVPINNDGSFYISKLVQSDMSHFTVTYNDIVVGKYN